jgi:hypothetical protein
MTPDDFSPSEHPFQVAARDELIHKRAEELRTDLLAIARCEADEVHGMRLKLEHAGRELLKAMIEVDAITAVRNELVVEATETYRLPRSYVATAAVLTRGRVQQLISRERDQRLCPSCDAEVPEPTTARQIGTGPSDAVAWQPWVQTSVCTGCGAVLERNQEPGPAHAWRTR